MTSNYQIGGKNMENMEKYSKPGVLPVRWLGVVNIEPDTAQWRGDMDFNFEWQEQCLTVKLYKKYELF